MNPHTFEVEDLDRLIRSVNVVAQCYFVLNEKYNILKVFVPLHSPAVERKRKQEPMQLLNSYTKIGP